VDALMGGIIPEGLQLIDHGGAVDGLEQ